MFKKIACCTDLHLGEGGDDKEHNEFCLEFLRWFISTALSNNCDTLAFLGDWHHHRNKVGAETLNYSHAAIKLLEDSGLKTYFVIGNHDLFFKDNRLIHSIPFVADCKNIRVINEITRVGDCLFVPWLVAEDDLSKVSKTDARYIFGHFELPGFLMNEHYVMPQTDSSLNSELLSGPEYLFSGHFHKRQFKTTKTGLKIHYIGNCFPHSFSDVDDTNRGMMILEHGGEPVFIDWPDMPTYRRVLLSDFLDKPNDYNNRTRIKIVQDVVMTQSERVELRKMVTDTYGIHNLGIEALKIDVDISEMKVDLENENNIDNMVVTFVNRQDYTKERLDQAKLTRFYLDA